MVEARKKEHGIVRQIAQQCSFAVDTEKLTTERAGLSPALITHTYVYGVAVYFRITGMIKYPPV